MNGRDLFLAALRGEPTLRRPVAPLAVHFCARVAGISLHDYTAHAELLADAVLRYHERFQPDAVVVSADTWVSAQAMGAEVGSLGADQPWGGTGQALVRTRADVDAIPSPDPARQGRYPLMVEAVRRVKAGLGGRAAVVVCFDQYPFSLAAALMDINVLMLALEDDPGLVQAVMAKAHDYALAYGTALAEAGADALTGGDSPAGLIGPRRYAAVALPAEQRLITALRTATGKPVSLHICGNAESLLADMARSGADVLEIDHLTDLGLACRVGEPAVALWGNLDPVGVLARGTPERVQAAAQAALLAAGGNARFVLGSGCTLAVETPPANVEAMVAAVG